MVEDPEISGDDLVLEDGAGRDVDPVPLVGDDDDGALEHDALPEGDVAADGEVVQLDDVRDAAEALQELVDLLEVLVAQLDEGRRLEHPVGRHLEGPVRQGVEVAHDEQEVGGLLHGEEARPGNGIDNFLICTQTFEGKCLSPWHVYPYPLLEALHGRSHGGLELDDVDSVIEGLWVDDDLHVHRSIFQNALDGCKKYKN